MLCVCRGCREKETRSGHKLERRLSHQEARLNLPRKCRIGITICRQPFSTFNCDDDDGHLLVQSVCLRPWKVAEKQVSLQAKRPTSLFFCSHKSPSLQRLLD